MDRHNGQGTIGMPRGSTLRIDDGAGALLYVREGELWITEEGSADDHVLGAGQWFRLERDGAALVQALSRSTVSVTPASPRRFALLRALYRSLRPA